MSINSFNTTPKSKLKTAQTGKTKDFISRNIFKGKSEAKYETNITLNKTTHFTKPFMNKYNSQDKIKIEVKKMEKNIMKNKLKSKLNSSSHISNCMKNTEASLTNENKRAHKSNKNMIHLHLDTQESTHKINSLPFTNKDKAISSLIKSNVLTLKEKMILWYTNPNIKSQIAKKKIIKDFRTLIQTKLKLYGAKTTFKPSSTAKNCLSFITPIDEEEFKQLAKKSNKAELFPLTGFMKLLYALLGIKSGNMIISDMIQNVYTKIFKEYNITSISKDV